MADPKPPRTEIWLRKIYRPFVEDRRLTTIFRPGRRLLSEHHPKALGIGEKVRVRIIDQVGADWSGVYGTLLAEPDVPVVITSVAVTRLGALEPDDFTGSTPDANNRTGLVLQLALIYNLSREELSDDFQLTRTAFQYL